MVEAYSEDYYGPLNPSTSTATLIGAHGILMAIPVILLWPVAILLARHRHLFDLERLVWGKALWYHIHMPLNTVGALSMIAGFALAYTKLPVRPMPCGGVGAAHRVLGILCFALAWVQVLVALFLRPAPESPRRRLFNLFHHNWGRLTIVVGWGATFTGIYTHHKPLGQTSSLLAHAISFGIFTALLLLLDVYLTFFMAKPPRPGSPNAIAAQQHSSAFKDMEEGSPSSARASPIPLPIKAVAA